MVYSSAIAIADDKSVISDNKTSVPQFKMSYHFNFQNEGVAGAEFDSGNGKMKQLYMKIPNHQCLQT
jgi:hypothetical protein